MLVFYLRQLFVEVLFSTPLNLVWPAFSHLLTIVNLKNTYNFSYLSIRKNKVVRFHFQVVPNDAYCACDPYLLRNRPYCASVNAPPRNCSNPNGKLRPTLCYLPRIVIAKLSSCRLSQPVILVTIYKLLLAMVL